MREAQFLKHNAEKWRLYKAELTGNPDVDILANRFIELTDDLAYSKTFYPKSKTTEYLNGLAAQFHQLIYKNKKENSGRVIWFWQFELPYLFKYYQKQFLYALLFFIVFVLMGALSARYDENFVRLILGDGYVNMTLDNIEKGDPFGVYKHNTSWDMFVFIAGNNIRVAFITYVLGIGFSIGSVLLLMYNGLMLGSFQQFFISKGLGAKFITVVFIHGTLELWSIVVAGAAGLILGNSLLFPGTYSRKESVVNGAKDGLKIVTGLIPFFIIAAFLESFVTRHTEMPLMISTTILVCSAALIVWYFIIYPFILHRRINNNSNQNLRINKQNLSLWINQKFNSGK